MRMPKFSSIPIIALRTSGRSHASDRAIGALGLSEERAELGLNPLGECDQRRSATHCNARIPARAAYEREHYRKMQR